MKSNMAQTTIRPADLVRTAWAHPLRSVAPIVVATLLAVSYAMVRPATWEASQALMVRSEAGDRLTRPGKFIHTDEMKTSQETVLELAKSRGVLSKALAELTPAAASGSISGDSERGLEALAAKVKIAPPKGAEFGKTEVFYLKVQDENPQRAIDLASALCHQLQVRFAELREAKARSTTDELTKTVSLAQQELDRATVALKEIEQQMGSDLAELRILNESPSGDSDLRRTATELEKELRTCQASQTESAAFLKLLTAAAQDPTQLLASPSVLLKSQPALGRLKDGLVDAQLRTGQMQGTMSDDHPLVRGARSTEKAIRDQLHDEIALAVRGVELDVRVNAERAAALTTQYAAIQERLGRLAAVRAEYANLVTASKARGETLKAVEQELAESRASQSAARTSSLINLVDTPDAGTRPVGPGRTAIVAAGFGGGALISLALILLTVVPVPTLGVPAGRTAPVASRIEQVVNLTLKQALQRVSRTAM